MSKVDYVFDIICSTVFGALIGIVWSYAKKMFATIKKASKEKNDADAQNRDPRFTAKSLFADHADDVRHAILMTLLAFIVCSPVIVAYYLVHFR